MNFFEIFILNSIYVLFPVMLYLLYFLYCSASHKKTNDLILDFCLLTSFYLLGRFGVLENGLISILMFNVPLLVAYINKRDLSIIILSSMIVYYWFKLGFGLVYLIEYLVYYLLYVKCIKKDNNRRMFVNLFVMFKCIIFIIIAVGSIGIYKSLLYVILFLLLCFLIVFLLEKGKELMKIRLTFKELEKEKQIKLSLFKITHEIKNPIAVCKGYLDMFDVNNKEHARKYIPIIRSEINRTLFLLQDFLDCNHLKINKEILDINMLLEDVNSACMPLINSKKINYISNVGEDELYIDGDYERLKQVFINIIKNSIEAIDYKQDSYIELNTEVRKNNIHIFIEDNGTGMTENDLKRIKEPFYTTKRDGTGLGLTLSFDIIKAHNGKIVYDSKYGQWTKAEIILPLLKNYEQFN